KAVVRKWREQGCSRQVREGLQWSMILGAARAKRRNPACSQPHLHRRLVRRRHPPRTRRSRSDGGGQGCKTAAWIDIVEVITFISTSYVQVCLAAVFAGAATGCPVKTTFLEFAKASSALVRGQAAATQNVRQHLATILDLAPSA